MFFSARIFSAEKMLRARAVALASRFKTYTFNYFNLLFISVKFSVDFFKLLVGDVGINLSCRNG